ncbi:hypothetical protein QJS10_CPA08g01292 [Acorus calamus]|uniref:Uncharacterized protein n=1 Tax=Acorus calamus TaxID=4465 RepID=A0AAV9EC42_ACOCL|nr:hypothetical protein QJS10_CPA08g01292 [Acorus calamus]
MECESEVVVVVCERELVVEVLVVVECESEVVVDECERELVVEVFVVVVVEWRVVERSSKDTWLLMEDAL